MGAGGEQKEWLATMAPLKNTILAYSKEKNAPLLRDFHMIGSGYNESNFFEAQMIPRTSEGKKPVGMGSKLTYRYYLQDAFFSAVVEVPEEQSERISQALMNPVWDLFLGRKNCAPSDFIFRGIFQTEDEAIAKASEIEKEKSIKEIFRVLDGRHVGEVIVLNDVPLEFGQNKTYKQRYVTVIRHEQ
jgi:CRISPR system Cascade subunit CasD